MHGLHVCVFLPISPILYCVCQLTPLTGSSVEKIPNTSHCQQATLTAKYTAAWEQDLILSPQSYMWVHVREFHGWPSDAYPRAHAHFADGRLFSHLCAKAYFLPLTMSPLSVGEIFMRRGSSPLLFFFFFFFFWSPDVRSGYASYAEKLGIVTPQTQKGERRGEKSGEYTRTSRRETGEERSRRGGRERDRGSWGRGGRMSGEQTRGGHWVRRVLKKPQRKWRERQGWEERMSSAAWLGKRLVNQSKLDNSLPTSPRFHITRAQWMKIGD